MLNKPPANSNQASIVASIKSDSYWTAVQELKAKYFGGIDNYLKDQYMGINNTEKVTFKETIQLSTMGTIRSGAVCKFVFPILPSNKFVYKNLRITSNKFNAIIEICELKCNGSSIDSCYGRAFNALRYIYNITDDTLFPFDFCRDDKYLPNNSTYCAYTRFTPKEFNMNVDDFGLSVDVYEIDNADFNSDAFAYDGIISVCDFTGAEYALKSCNSCKIKLNYNHVINYIMVSIPNTKINRIILQMEGIVVCNIPITDMFCYDNHYIIPFTPELNLTNIATYGINFSSIDTTTIMIDYEVYADDVANPTYVDGAFVPIYIYGITTNVLMGKNEQTGLRYAG
jgi:hypothetical protein